MSHLAQPLERIRSHYDVVVVGSGYGGAIAASRMARAGKKVCVLERGEELQPGDFPDNALEGAREIQIDAPDRRIGSPSGLFDFRVNPEISVLVGCGLGGTSLINANVVLPPDPRVLEDPVWPEALRADVDTRFAEGMRRAREMLRPTSFPVQLPPPSKLRAMERSARHMGAHFDRPPIAVNFAEGVNHVGVPQHACTGCGDCVSGCNVGAKNSLIMNYLPDAKNHGAEIFTCASVRRVERRHGQWLVHFNVVGLGQPRPLFVAADSVFLAAGALGSTEILLRSREAGLRVSDALGEGFTGNGDVLAFAYNCDEPIHGIGTGLASDRTRPGPCISGIIDLRDTPRLEDGMVIEEGVIPSALASLMPASLAAAAAMLGRDTDSGAGDFANERLREINAVLFGAYSGAMCNTQTFLVMAHDDARGRMHLEDDRVRISWPGVGSQRIFHAVRDRLEQATAALGGTFLKNPMWSELTNNSLVTVHPLGGCRMADSAERGVVNHLGQVFVGSSGDEVYPGLFVCDGAVIPRAVGVNPLLTISALAERSCALIAEANGSPISYQLPSRPAASTPPRRIGIRFTETMRGQIVTADAVAATDGAALDLESGSPFEFTVTVASDDLEMMLESPDHHARLFGTAVAPELSPHALAVSGDFHLLTADADRVGTRQMRYRMQMVTEEGTRFFLDGIKIIRDDRGIDVWADTTTLYVTVYAGDDESAPVAGRGVLRIHPADFARQLTTLKVTGAGTLRERLAAVASFGRFFAGSLYDTYGGVLARRSVLDPNAPPRKRRPLNAPMPEVHFVTAGDGAQLRLTRYRGGGRRTILLAHTLGTSSFMFTLDTIDTNLVEYLSAHEYDVWLLDYRASTELPHSATRFTAEEVARFDYPAAVAGIRALTGAEAVDVIAHGYGSVSLLTALLEGMPGVRSAVCSQLGLHLRVPITSRLKAGLHLPAVLKACGIDSLTAFASADSSLHGRIADMGLRLFPVEYEEWCRSPVCRRVTFMYGQLFEHDQLNAATHDALHELFGVASLSALDHLAAMVRKGHLVDAAGKDSYLSSLERLALPITFIHGAENASVLPVSTEETVAMLAQRNGRELYHRVLVPHYGEIDCVIGKNAVNDVYPLILEHLEARAPGRKSATPQQSASEPRTGAPAARPHVPAP